MNKGFEALHTIAFNTQINGMNFGNELRTIEEELNCLKKYDEILKDRITKKIEDPQYMNDYDQLCNHSYTIINKLGKLEDIYEEAHKDE